MYALTCGTKKEAGAWTRRPFQWISLDSAGSSPNRTRSSVDLPAANATGYNGKTPLLQSQVDIENALL